MTYPARLTEDGGIERTGPTEVISEADPTWGQWDQDRRFAHRSDSDYKERAFASTAAHIPLPVSAKDSWEWRGSYCLVRVHHQAHRCLFYSYMEGRHLAQLEGTSNTENLCDTCWTEEAFESCDQEC